MLSNLYSSSVPLSIPTSFTGMEEASGSQIMHRQKPKPIPRANLPIYLPSPTLLSQVGCCSRSMPGFFSRLVGPPLGSTQVSGILATVFPCSFIPFWALLQQTPFYQDFRIEKLWCRLWISSLGLQFQPPFVLPSWATSVGKLNTQFS